MLRRGYKVVHPLVFKKKWDKKFTPIKFRDYQHLLLLCNSHNGGHNSDLFSGFGRPATESIQYDVTTKTECI